MHFSGTQWYYCSNIIIMFSTLTCLRYRSRHSVLLFDADYMYFDAADFMYVIFHNLCFELICVTSIWRCSSIVLIEMQATVSVENVVIIISLSMSQKEGTVLSSYWLSIVLTFDYLYEP